MTLNTSTKMVSPDKRKGLVSVYQSDDQLMHLTWKDRGTGTLEDDLIIFPDDCEFLAVPACTTGRVFVLKFKTNNKRMFFWMQEPKADKDEEICKKVNDSLNNPPAAGSARSAGSGLGGVLPPGLDFNNLGDTELQNLLNNMSQSQLMQLFGGGLAGAGGNMPGLASLLGGGSAAGGGRSRQAAGTSSRSRPALAPDTPPSSSAAVAAAQRRLRPLLHRAPPPPRRQRPALIRRSSCRISSPFYRTFRFRREPRAPSAVPAAPPSTCRPG